jgi:competence protein ComEC
VSADLRLFGFALSLWGACAAGLWLPADRAWWAGTGVAALLLLGLGAPRLVRRRYRPRHRRPRVVWAVAAGLLGAVCGFTTTAAQLAVRDSGPLVELARNRSSVVAELLVTEDPRPVRSSSPGPPTFVVPGRLIEVREPAGRPIRLGGRVLVFATDPAWRGLLPSQRLVTGGRLGAPRGGDLTAAVLTATGAPQLRDRPSWTQTAAGRLRSGLQAACAGLPAEVAGLLPGLVIGDTSRLDPALAEDFRTTGLTHLVAVSGANVAIVLGLVLFAARWCRAGPWLTAGISGVALVGFVILVRPSPSVVRAAAMGAVALLALASGRVRVASAALAAAVAVGLMLDPALALDAGFALSVLATGALVLLAPRWRDALRSRGVPSGLAEAVAVPAAAQAACGPVIVALSGQVSLVAVPANLLAAPAVAPATVFGVASAALSPLWTDGARGLAWLASWPARWLAAIAHTGARVPAGSIGWVPGLAGGLLLAAVTVAALAAARRPVVRRVMVVGALGVAVGALPVRWVSPGWPAAGTVVVACDVGQGDAIVLPDGDRAAVVVDAGPDPVPVDACLRRLGIERVTLLVLTHFHADHVGGVAGVLRGRTVAAMVLPTFAEPVAGEDLARRAAAAGSVPVAEVGVGWSYRHGDVELLVVGPARPLTGTRSDPNNNSLLVRATVAGVGILLLGDAETEEQHALLAAVGRDAVRSAVLKVAHHGSAYQDPELLSAVRPRVALVSVGLDNGYGHPNGPVLQRLTDDGARVLRTDRDGDIAVTAGPSGLAVLTHPPP